MMASSTKPTWLSKALLVKRAAVKSGSPEVFIQPIFRGKSIVLEYRNLKLRVRDLDKETIQVLKRSGVPRLLHNTQYRNWGSHTPAVLYVHGKIIRSRKDDNTRRFVATSVSTKLELPYHNQLTSIHLLFARGFYTPIAQSSWMKTENITAETLTTRLIRKADLRVETINGKAFTPIAPVGLTLYDCMATETLTQKKAKTAHGRSSKGKV